MKNIELENKDLAPAILFLQSLPLKGKATRGKQKFIERLIEKNKEYADQEKAVVKPYSTLNEEGEPTVTDGRYELKKDISDEEKKQLLKERVELEEESAEVSFAEYSSKYEALFEVLDDWQEPISPEHSFIYNKLMDQYEANEDKKEEEK